MNSYFLRKNFILEEALEYLDIDEEEDFLSLLNYYFEESNLRVENYKLQKKIILEPFNYPEDYNFLDLDAPVLYLIIIQNL